MRLGMFMMPLHPPDKSMSECLKEDTAKSILADQLGFTELWMGEHFAATTEPYASPLMFLTNLLSQTKNLTFGTGVINLPNHHPAVVAGEVAQFDHMSGGNFLFGIGPGGLASDFELFGNSDGDVRTAKLIESIEFIQKIWAQDPPYDLEGEFWTVKIKDAILPDLGIGYLSKPVQQPHPPISLSIASPHSSSCRLAAERGWGIISANISPTYSVASHWEIYCETSEQAGRRAVSDDWRVARNLLVAPSDSEAEERLWHEASANDYYFTYMHGVFDFLGILILVKPDPEMSDEATTPAVITEELVTYGSPKTVIDKLVDFRDRVGPFGTLLATGVDWSGPNEEWEKQSMRLLAEDVMPKFRQHVTATAAQ